MAGGWDVESGRWIVEPRDRKLCDRTVDTLNGVDARSYERAPTKATLKALAGVWSPGR